MKHTKELLMKSRVLVGGDREKIMVIKLKITITLPSYGQHIWMYLLQHMTWPL